MSVIKQLIFGTKNCNCNRRRNDGLHNMNCQSWHNAWFPARLKRSYTQPKPGEGE